MLRKKLLAIAASMALIAGLLTAGLIGATSASATNCNNGHACYYWADNLGGPSFGDECGISNFASFNFNGSSYPLDNDVDSAKGASYAYVDLFTLPNDAGSMYTLNFGQTYNDLGAGMDNQASSSRFRYIGGSCPGG